MELSFIHWVGFFILLFIMLFVDLFVNSKKKHDISFKQALVLSAVWVAIALIFNFFVFYFMGKQKGVEFLTGYLLEKSLSIDNIFVFILLFTYFNVPGKYQHKVLFWGIIGALVLRGALIALGTALIMKFHWIIFIFGAFLVFTGIKMVFQKDEQIDPGKNTLVKLFRKIFPVTPRYIKDKFFIRSKSKTYATPLFIVLIIVETTDFVFAFDSIPAILAITQDSFIVFTSNVFAILGLRALYFALAKFMVFFRYLKYGLSVILVFIGVKMLISDFFHIPTLISLGVLVLILAVSILFSILKNKKENIKISFE